MEAPKRSVSQFLAQYRAAGDVRPPDLIVDQVREDKVYLRSRTMSGTALELTRELFSVRLEPDGSLSFEFDRAVCLRLGASNAFKVSFE